MNYAQSFNEFAASLGPTDLALYAGVAVVLWILFKDKLNPVTTFISGIVEKTKGLLDQKKTSSPIVNIPVANYIKENNKQDVFFDLVVSWKKTRDLAVSAGCGEAVKVADQMFPFLSPNICGDSQNKVAVSSRFTQKDNV